MPTFYPTPKRFTQGDGSLDTSAIDRSAFDALTTVAPDNFLTEESYRMEFSAGRKSVVLASERARDYAWQHFLQWQGERPSAMPCGFLEDEPAFARRGFMLDISRCKIPTMETFSQLVKELAAFRFNELQLYTEHTFAYAGHEIVWRDSSPITPGELLQIQAWCQEAGITLVPNQNSFGHFERWLKHAEYQRFAESPDGFVTPWGDHRSVGSVLEPSAGSAALIYDLHDQLLPWFPEGSDFNIGCDETFELGQGKSKELCEERGRQAVYVEFVKSIADRVADRYGKRCQFWADIVLQDPEWLKLLRPDMIALNWGYEADHPFETECAALAEAGLEFHVCPGTSSWRSFVGRTDNMLENIANATREGLKNGANGFLLTDWGDCGHHQPWEVTRPALAWAATCAWSGTAAEQETAWIWCKTTTGQDPTPWLEYGRLANQLSFQPSNANAAFNMFLKPLDDDRVPTAEILSCLEDANAVRVACDASRQAVGNFLFGLAKELKRRGIKVDLPDFCDDLPTLHAKLWRSRNREGGLAESLSYYGEDPRVS